MINSPSSKDASGQLAQGFKPRHVTMLSIAGIIGAGLFVGSGHAIAAAGPAVMLAYLFSGLLVVLVMRMLGEMAVANPDTGSFSTYADQAIGRWAGLTIGWLYWWFWVLVIPIEALAAGHILNQWFPQIDAWLFALLSIFLLVVTNLFSVSKYGEFEFWFAMAKVVAIAAKVTCRAPSEAARTRCFPRSWCRMMFSNTMMASSTMIPTTSESPSIVKLLMVNPQK